MLDDIVVDTNILGHAANPREARFGAAQDFLNALIDSDTRLCVDLGFSLEEATNRSFCGTEYRPYLIFGSLGFSVISHLAASNRIKEIQRESAPPTVRKVNRLIRKPGDRTFLRLTIKSQSLTLVSHDFEDFSHKKRGTIRKTFGVRIIEADEACDVVCACFA